MEVFRCVLLSVFVADSVWSLSSTTGLSPNLRFLAESPPFPRTWVPLASVAELDPDRPTPLQFLGQSYVSYQDNDGHWVVFDDACPHRLAPLSEGRINRQEGVLECSYHGWAFNSEGICQRIPQADAATAKAAFRSPRCNAQSYPTYVEKNILFAWVWPEDPLTAIGNELAQPEAILARVLPNCSTYSRDLPYGWDTLLENILDPAHVPWVRVLSVFESVRRSVLQELQSKLTRCRSSPPLFGLLY